MGRHHRDQDRVRSQHASELVEVDPSVGVDGEQCELDDAKLVEELKGLQDGGVFQRRGDDVASFVMEGVDGRV